VANTKAECEAVKNENAKVVSVCLTEGIDPRPLPPLREGSRK